jgi:hypothetical protein
VKAQRTLNGNHEKQYCLHSFSKTSGVQKELSCELNHFCGHAESTGLRPHTHKMHQTPAGHLESAEQCLQGDMPVRKEHLNVRNYHH